MRLAVGRLYRASLLWIGTAVILAGLFLGSIAWHPPIVRAQAAAGLPADATCAQLAHADPTATNQPGWGITLLPGHNAKGGWFGVDVCGNGINDVSPGGANLSCDRVPTDLAKTGCAPGHATADGFGLSFQCVELVVRFAAWAFRDHPADWLGNAPDLWLSGHHPPDFTAVPNGGMQAPVPGDVLVWGPVDASGHPWPNGSADGHVAVVAAVHGTQLAFVEENALAGGRNIPEETSTLHHAGQSWTVGSSAPVPAGARGLYGWLHSRKNTGVWPGQPPTPDTTPVVGTATATPTTADTTRQVPTGPAPAVTGAAVVTTAGSLADLTWTTATSPIASNATSTASAANVGPPHLAARSLGAPSQSALAPTQTPAVVLDTAGTRTIFVLGTDGQLYSATTAPGLLGVLWQSLGSPSGAPPTGSPVAATFVGGAQVAVLDTTGQAWWRGGPTGHLGSWISLGAPSGTPLIALWLGCAPGSGVPLLAGLSADGGLYVTRAAADGALARGAPLTWEAWTPINMPEQTAPLSGPLLGLSEAPPGATATGTWTDAPVDILAANAVGGVTLARLTASDGWRVQPVPAASAMIQLVAATTVIPPRGQASTSTLLHVYAADAAGLALGAVTITTRSGAVAAKWEALPETKVPAGSASAASPCAIAFGNDTSLLVVPSGSRIVLAGTKTALATAEPSGASPQPASAAAASAVPAAPLVSAGSVAGAGSFTDLFTGPTLAPGWVWVGAAPTVSMRQLTLPPAADTGTSLLVQAAPAGDATLETTVTMPAGAAPALRGGLVLALDTANWLTLSLAGDGKVALCAQAWGAKATCQQVALPQAQAIGHPVLLTLTRRGETYTASAATVTQGGIAVSVWSPALPAGVTPVPTTNALDLATQNRATSAENAQSAVRISAPLTFTSAGLFTGDDKGESATAATDSPRFAYFAVASLVSSGG